MVEGGLMQGETGAVMKKEWVRECLRGCKEDILWRQEHNHSGIVMNELGLNGVKMNRF